MQGRVGGWACRLQQPLGSPCAAVETGVTEACPRSLVGMPLLASALPQSAEPAESGHRASSSYLDRPDFMWRLPHWCERLAPASNSAESQSDTWVLNHVSAAGASGPPVRRCEAGSTVAARGHSGRPACRAFPLARHRSQAVSTWR